MNAGLDTSVTLRLLTGEPAAQAEAAHRLVATAGHATISDLVVGETYLALRHHYGVPHAEALRQLLELLEDTRVVPSGMAPVVLREALAARSSATAAGLIDRLIRADYAMNGLEVFTFDRNFARLSGVRLV